MFKNRTQNTFISLWAKCFESSVSVRCIWLWYRKASYSFKRMRWNNVTVPILQQFFFSFSAFSKYFSVKAMVLRYKHICSDTGIIIFCIRFEEGMAKAELSPSAAASAVDPWAELSPSAVAGPKADPSEEATDILISR